MGSAIAVVILPLVILGLEIIDYHIFNTPYCALYMFLIVVFLLYIYPVDSQHWSTDRGDHGSHSGLQYGVPLGAVCHRTHPRGP